MNSSVAGLPDSSGTAADGATTPAPPPGEADPAGSVRVLLIAAGIACAVHLAVRSGLAAALPPLHDELYHREWAVYPQWCYVDHPPMVAWLIATSVAAFGHDSAAVLRAPFVAVGTLLPIVVAACGASLFGDRVIGLRAFLIASSLGLFAVLGVVAHPGAPALIFEIVFLERAYAALRRPHPWRESAAAAALGLALLCRLNVLGSAAYVAAFALTRPELRTWASAARIGRMYAGALIVACPVVLWNAHHEWVGIAVWLDWERFRPFAFGPLLEVPVEQFAAAGLLLPALATALFADIRALPAEQRTAYDFLRFHALSTAAVFVLSAPWTQIHPQTLMSAYPTAVLCLAVHWSTTAGPLFRRGMAVLPAANGALLVVVGVTAACALKPALTFAADVFPAWRTKLAQTHHRLFGWEATAGALDALRRTAAGDDGVLFTLGHERAAVVAYHLKRPVYNMTAMGDRPPGQGEAQRHYLDHSVLRGCRGLFFTPLPGANLDLIRIFFREVEELPPLEITHDGVPAARFQILRVSDPTDAAFPGGTAPAGR